MTQPTPTTSCRCKECAETHEEFITHFGHWPTMTHDEGQKLKARRISNETSFKQLADRRTNK